MTTYDVYGIGNALVDFLIEVDDSVLSDLGLTKGQFHLYNKEQAQELLEKLNMERITIVPGGSSANTIAGVSFLGGKGTFMGKVGSDKQGELYATETEKTDVKPNLAISDDLMTGYAITFITPDSERTFAVHLGAAASLSKQDVATDDVAHSKIVHVEGYLLEMQESREAAEHLMDVAKQNNVLVSLDLCDAGVIERAREHITRIVKDYVDIVFANEMEAKAFTGKEEEDALHVLSDYCDIAVVKIGARGSFIKQKGEVHRIPAFKTSSVDTTGAGDMYSAGVLYALSQGLSVSQGGRIGSVAASLVVSQIGARLQHSR